MRKWNFMWALIVVLVVSAANCQGTETATEAMGGEVGDDFPRYPPIEEPVFETISAEPAAFEPPLPDGSYVFVGGSLIFEANQYVLFFSLFSDNEGPHAVYMATSEDGTSWQVASEPILQASPASGEFYIVSDIIQDGDGIWHLYITSNLGAPEYSSQYSIWQATAPSLDGPWTLVDEPLLERGDPDTWDQGAVLMPLILETDYGYLMYYHGASTDEGNLETSIGMAVSVDGSEWVRGVPGGVESPYPELDNVVISRFDGEWGDLLAHEVWRTTDGWQMIYTQFFDQQRMPQLRMATSADGIEWEPMQEQVSFTLSGLAYFPGALGGMLLPRADGYDMMIVVFESASEFNLFMTQLRYEP